MNATTCLPAAPTREPMTAFAAARASQLAAELDDAQCAVLARCITVRDLTPGEVLVHEGTSDDHLYGVLEGTLGHIKSEGTVNAVTLNTVGAGEFSGELSFIDGLPRYGSLTALGPTCVFGLKRSALESLVESHPLIVYRVMRSIVRAAHEIQRRLSLQATELSNYIFKQHGRY